MLNCRTEDEEVDDGSFLSAPSAVTRDVWVEVRENLERQKKVMK